MGYRRNQALMWDCPGSVCIPRGDFQCLGRGYLPWGKRRRLEWSSGIWEAGRHLGSCTLRTGMLWGSRRPWDSVCPPNNGGHTGTRATGTRPTHDLTGQGKLRAGDGRGWMQRARHHRRFWGSSPCSVGHRPVGRWGRRVDAFEGRTGERSGYKVWLWGNEPCTSPHDAVGLG